MPSTWPSLVKCTRKWNPKSILCSRDEGVYCTVCMQCVKHHYILDVRLVSLWGICDFIAVWSQTPDALVTETDGRSCFAGLRLLSCMLNFDLKHCSGTNPPMDATTPCFQLQQLIGKFTDGPNHPKTECVSVIFEDVTYTKRFLETVFTQKLHKWLQGNT